MQIHVALRRIWGRIWQDILRTQYVRHMSCTWFVNKLEKYQSCTFYLELLIIIILQYISQNSPCVCSALIHCVQIIFLGKLVWLVSPYSLGLFYYRCGNHKIVQCQWDTLEIYTLWRLPISRDHLTPNNGRKTAIARPLGRVFWCGWLPTNYLYLSGLFQWRWGRHTIGAVSVKQKWKCH